MKQTVQNWATSLLLFIPFLSFAQLEEALPLVEMHRLVAATQKVSAVGDTIEMPISDDFSRKSTRPNPKTWADNKAYVNSHIPTGMYSIGAATLDGTNEYGMPYDISDNSSDSLADVLTSRYFKFITPPSNVYLSFFYQAAGLGDVPEMEDSLVVEFWSPLDSAWEQVWVVKGQEIATPFRAAIIPVDDPKWLIDGFRFRFGAYGARNGTFDVWNLDYVELDENRTPDDTIIKEPAFVKPHPYLSTPFTHIPWFHYNDNQLKDSLAFTYRRNGPPPSGGWALNLGKYDVQKNGTTIKDRLTVPVVTNLNHNVDVDFKVPFKPVSSGAPTEEFNLSMRTWFDGTAEGLRQNDTVEISIPFKNDYAFDDNSAEHGYGIKNQINARMAFQFQPLVPDTMHGLFINFAHVGVDATLNTFRIAIWQDDNGEPGLLLYLSDSLYKPVYPFYHNGFMPFELKNPQYIPGSVFIGMVQTKADPIHVGLDKNTVGTTAKYYGSGFTWDESLVDGTWMIRPYFRYAPKDFGIEPLKKEAVIVYPNPATNHVYIKTNFEGDYTWELVNSLGQLVKTGNHAEINVDDLPRGLYILRIVKGQQFSTQKIILQ